MSRSLFVALSMGLLAMLSAVQAQAPAARVTPETYYLQAMTDANGNFDVPHGISVVTSGEGTIIVGVIVSVQNGTNDAWYTVYATGRGSRIAWNHQNVSGRMQDAIFASQRVQILIFTLHMLG